MICKIEDPTKILWSGIGFVRTVISRRDEPELCLSYCGHMFHR